MVGIELDEVVDNLHGLTGTAVLGVQEAEALQGILARWLQPEQMVIVLAGLAVVLLSGVEVGTEEEGLSVVGTEIQHGRVVGQGTLLIAQTIIEGGTVQEKSQRSG